MGGQESREDDIVGKRVVDDVITNRRIRSIFQKIESFVPCARMDLLPINCERLRVAEEDSKTAETEKGTHWPNEQRQSQSLAPVSNVG